MLSGKNLFVLGVGVAALAAVPAAVDAKTVKITAVGAPPPVVTPVKTTKEYIIPEINKRIAATGKDFKIEWQEAWSSSLAKFNEVLEAVEEGIAQFGVQLVIFEESKLPMEQYGKVVPFASDDNEVINDVDRAVRRRVPAMNKYWGRYNQIRFSGAAGSATQLWTKFPVTKVADLKGHKIGASGSMGQFLRGSGATVVNSSMLDAYTSIKNGLYEGYAAGIPLSFPYKIYEGAPNMAPLNFSASVTATLSMNRDAWAKLPGWVQKIFLDVSAHYGTEYAKIETFRIKRFMGIMKKRGVTVHPFPDSERRKLAQLMPNIPRQWAESLEKRGVPGKAVLTAYMDELRARKLDPLRQWDKEPM